MCYMWCGVYAHFCIPCSWNIILFQKRKKEIMERKVLNVEEPDAQATKKLKLSLVQQ